MSKDIACHAKFIRALSIFLLIFLGTIPLAALAVFGLILFHPYASLGSIVLGVYVYKYSRVLSQLSQESS